MCWRLRFQPKSIKIQLFLTKFEAPNGTDEIGLKLSFLKADEIGLVISRVCRQTPNSLVPSIVVRNDALLYRVFGRLKDLNLASLRKLSPLTAR